jgi:hypothetical protein
MNAKLLIGLLILLVILFAAGLAGDALAPGEARPDLSPDGLAQLVGGLFKPAPLTPQDLSAAAPAECAAAFAAGAFTLQPGLPCTLFISASQARFAPVRALELHLAQGAAANLVYRPSGDGLTAKYKVDGDHPSARVQIFKEGGMLELSCLSGAGAACRLVIIQEAD